jgi:hypothetical protein
LSPGRDLNDVDTTFRIHRENTTRGNPYSFEFDLGRWGWTFGTSNADASGAPVAMTVTERR